MHARLPCLATDTKRTPMPSWWTHSNWWQTTKAFCCSISSVINCNQIENARCFVLFILLFCYIKIRITYCEYVIHWMRAHHTAARLLATWVEPISIHRLVGCNQMNCANANDRLDAFIHLCVSVANVANASTVAMWSRIIIRQAELRLRDSHFSLKQKKSFCFHFDVKPYSGHMQRLNGCKRRATEEIAQNKHSHRMNEINKFCQRVCLKRSQTRVRWASGPLNVKTTPVQFIHSPMLPFTAFILKIYERKN